MAAVHARMAYITYSGILIVLGFLIMLLEGFEPDMMARVTGIIVMVCGIAKAVLYFSDDAYGLAFQFDLAQGIFFILIGILLLVKPFESIEKINVIVGLFIIADSSLKAQTAKEAKSFGMKCWKAILVFAILAALAGVFLAVSPLKAQPQAMTGAALVLDGVLNLIVAIYTVKLARRVKNKAGGSKE